MEDVIIIAFLSGIGVGIGLLWGFNRLLVGSVIRSLQHRSGIKAKTAQEENKEQFNAALAEAAVLISTGTPVQDVLKQLAIKYPGVAIDLMKKFGGV